MTRFAASLVARVIDDAFTSRARPFVSVAPCFGIDPVERRRGSVLERTVAKAQVGQVHCVASPAGRSADRIGWLAHGKLLGFVPALAMRFIASKLTAALGPAPRPVAPVFSPVRN